MQKKKSFSGNISKIERRDHPSWHFLKAREWLDDFTKNDNLNAIHYCAFEIRYGIEALIFMLLVLNIKDLSEDKYKECIKNHNSMIKYLKKCEPTYSKLINFTKLMLETDTNFNKPAVMFWDLNELKKYWGTVSKYMHFCGIHYTTYDSTTWIFESFSELDKITNIFIKPIKENINICLANPQRMTPLAYSIWQNYSSGKISLNDAKERLIIARPVKDLEIMNLNLFNYKIRN